MRAAQAITGAFPVPHHATYSTIEETLIGGKMEVSTFMTGYFIGLIVGIGAHYIWINFLHGVTIKDASHWWRTTLRDIAQGDEATFATRRIERRARVDRSLNVQE